MDAEYRRAHEAFMSNHTGTSPFEIQVISFNVHLCIILVACLALILAPLTSRLRRNSIEFLLLSLPLLLMLTVAADYYELLYCVLIAFAVILLTALISKKKKEKTAILGLDLAGGNKATSYHAPFVTNYRSSMLLTTAVCILAVDFRVFPRKFAKTETFGFGLMDIGVGSFVFSAGLVSQEARKGRGHLGKSLREAFPMLILGFARLISVKGSGYHEHVTEYGVHWNFFFTMALAKVFAALILTVIPVSMAWVMSLMISLCHEALLNPFLTSWVLDETTGRSTSVTANREGLTSLPGYVAI